MFKQFRRTKIVATLGPATDFNNNIEKIIQAGVNVIRLNFSHGVAEDHILRAKKIRDIAYKLGLNIAILGDLQGPKIRISSFKENKIFLNKDDTFILNSNLENNKGNKEQVGIDYKNLPNDVNSGDMLLLDDGRIHLKVLKVKDMKIYTKVIIGGYLSNNKGINKLGGGLSAEALTTKDKSDIIIAAQIGVDYIAISFPRNSKDIHYARTLIRNAGSCAKIVSKIERAEAINTEDIMDDIILASDAVMVARGDLGVEIGDSELISIQKKIISHARKLNRAVITATQMMESMINNPMPTRAEVMDVANAVLDGTDAVMLSAETATGKYPIETINNMSNICLGAEKIPSINISKHRINTKFNDIEETIAMSTMYAANHLKGITAIIAITESGKTPLIMSRISSSLPIFALSRHIHTLNLTSLYRGVIPIFFEYKNINNNVIANVAVNLLRDKKILLKDDLVIVTQSDTIDIVGTTNVSRILRVK